MYVLDIIDKGFKEGFILLGLEICSANVALIVTVCVGTLGGNLFAGVTFVISVCVGALGRLSSAKVTYVIIVFVGALGKL